MAKVYERCPKCGKKGAYVTGPRSWVTIFHGRRMVACRYCSYSATLPDHEKSTGERMWF